MLILSIGYPGWVLRWDFDQPFTILSSGTGYWGGSPAGSLWKEPGDVLAANEGHGALRFNGTFTSISWTADPEWWSGFTVGTAVPEPGEMALAAGVTLVGFGTWRRIRRA